MPGASTASGGAWATDSALRPALCTVHCSAVLGLLLPQVLAKRKEEVEAAAKRAKTQEAEIEVENEQWQRDLDAKKAQVAEEQELKSKEFEDFKESQEQQKVGPEPRLTRDRGRTAAMRTAKEGHICWHSGAREHGKQMAQRKENCL